MFDALNIAKYIILISNNNDKVITNLKLQKMLYYIQGYTLKFCDEPAFPEPIYKWPYGPVVPEVYFAYNQNGSRPIVGDEKDFISINKQMKSNKCLKRIVDFIIEKCLCMTDAEIVEMTRTEKPWQNTKDSTEISVKLIYFYFYTRDPLSLALHKGVGK